VDYVSTRGAAESLPDLESVLLGGLAHDGGLHLPTSWPRFRPEELSAFASLSYEELAFRVLRPFLGGAPSEAELEQSLAAAYATFDSPVRTPLLSLADGRWLLELHHGPTLSFKDVAMQLIARLMDRALERRGLRGALLCATSGDTGSAAIAAFAERERISAWVLYPEGRVSDVQRRQMTAPGAANVHALAVRGDFDDCQALVKAAFNDRGFRERVNLLAVNSINWGRILAQAVYYFHAGLRVGALQTPVTFVVPSGNFGNAFSGHAAGRMGLPVERIIVASNRNDILHRIIVGGRGERRPAVPTESPSMDIQAASNFERVLFELCEGDAACVRARMKTFAENGVLQLDPAERRKLTRRFGSAVASDEDGRAAIRAVWKANGIVIDPHTAVAVHAAQACRRPAGGPEVVLSTAHAAKFPEAVTAASGFRPSVPDRLRRALSGSEERIERLERDEEILKQRILEGVQA